MFLVWDQALKTGYSMDEFIINLQEPKDETMETLKVKPENL